jgi:hypothetical protein
LICGQFFSKAKRLGSEFQDFGRAPRFLNSNRQTSQHRQPKFEDARTPTQLVNALASGMRLNRRDMGPDASSQ